MASVAPSTDQRVMSPLCSFSAPAPGAAESRNASPPPNPEAAMAKALVAQMLPRRRCHFGGRRGSGSSDRVRKNLVAARDIGVSQVPTNAARGRVLPLEPEAGRSTENVGRPVLVG